MFTGNEQAKEMLIKLTDWAIELTKDLSDAQMEDMLRSEHGGPNEVFADVYAITGDPKYLTLAERFSQKAIIEPLTRYEDKLTGMHANTQIPKFIGCKRVADLANIYSWQHTSVSFCSYDTRNNSVAIV